MKKGRKKCITNLSLQDVLNTWVTLTAFFILAQNPKPLYPHHASEESRISTSPLVVATREVISLLTVALMMAVRK